MQMKRMRTDRGWRRHLAAALLAALALGPVAALAAPAAGPAAAGAIDVNKATVEELMAVKGIGEVLAQRIVEFREENGPYRTVDDLLKVKGIGEKLLDKIRGQLVVGKGRR